MNPILKVYLTVLFLCGLYCLIYAKKIKNRPIQFYVFISLITETIGSYTLYYLKPGKVFTVGFVVFTLLEIILLSLFFYSILANIKLKKVVIFLSVFLFTINLVKYSNLVFDNNYDNYFYTLNSIIFVTFSIFYLYQILRSNSENLLNENFWIAAAIIFFHTSFFFVSGFIDYISKENIELARKVYQINHFLNIIYYSLITFGLFLSTKRKAM